MNETPAPPTSPAGLSAGMDMLAVGRNVFGRAELPAPPVVEGYSEIIWLARGGFGTVWRARRDADGTAVALKIPHRTDPETAERMEQEAESLQALAHPNIVRLHGITAAANGTPVLVMELVDGPTLTARLPQHGFDFDHALQIFLPVLDAVAHAHARGIVHRDLKPGNILLAADGTPKVTDFGLAASLHDQRVNFTLTNSGIIAGTIEYLAPERYEPDTKAGTAADLYALGIILYELLTGRPPRGAWQSPSQVKQLDVRLDTLILEAIHPDPAKRLPSAEVFTKRLSEIRDTRPRYAGTPLVTKSVRTADLLWTLAGLYFLAAGYCSLDRINNTQVPALFDLTFGHTYMLGGFWALWTITLGMGCVWMWQLLRLWRFRRIPLRESLPSPFGVRLGHSRGAAVAVGIMQLLCAWAPLFFIGGIFAQTWVWVTPDTPVWHRGLAITRWGSEVPVSMWTWDPAGMFSGDRFWIRDMQPAYPEETWMLHDRQSFLVVTYPLLLGLAAAMIAAGILATCVAAVLEWRRRKPALLLLPFCALLAGGYSVRQSAAEESRTRLEQDTAAGRQEFAANQKRLRFLAPRARHFVAVLYSQSEAVPLTMHSVFAPTVSTGETESLVRTDLIAALLRTRAETEAHGRIIAALCLKRHKFAPGETKLEVRCELYTDPPDAAPTGSFHTLFLECRDPLHPDGYLTAWRETTRPLYTAEARALNGTDAAAWLDAFLHCLNTPGAPGLDDFFFPEILAPDPDNARYDLPTVRESLTSALRRSFTAAPATTFTAAAPPAVQPLPGARHHLDCRIRDSAAALTLRWQIELVPTGGTWKILRLRM